MLEIAARSILIYLFIVIAIRLFGKRELSQLSVIDLVFVLLLSNSVQNGMVGTNNSLLGAVVAATSLFGVNWILKNILTRSKKLNELVQGNAVMLIYNGKVNEKHLKAADMSLEELEAAIREHGVKSIKEVDLAVLEVDGNISIISDNFHKKTTKKKRIHKSLLDSN